MTHAGREELVSRFMLSMGKIARGMNAVFRQEMERCDVTWPQFHVLRFVSREGRVTVTDVSNMLMTSAPTASRMIEGLCAKGYLRKARDEADLRVARIELTRRAVDLVRELTDLQDRVMSEVFKEEDGAELERTVEHLGRMTDRWLSVAENAAKKERQ